MRIGFWDTESPGLLHQADKLHCLALKVDGKLISYADQKGYLSNAAGVEAVNAVDLRVAHNGQDHDDRLTRKVYGRELLNGSSLDTLIISRLLYTQIGRQGPNNHRLPPKLKMRHSLEAWGWRLGERKIDYSHIKAERIKAEHPDWTADQVMTEVWGTWEPEMSSYMDQDVHTLEKLFHWLMSRKPPMAAVETEHKFAYIMRRQEKWGFTFDMDEALKLQAEVAEKAQILEAELIESFGDFWMAGKEKTNKGTRAVKMTEFPNVTTRRFGKGGKELQPYIGPPKCHYEDGAKWTPVEFVQFKPSSPIHVEKMFRQRYGWRPKHFTDKGAVKLDDEVLRQLTYPEADKLADLYSLNKIIGYVSTGKNAWLKTAVQEGPDGKPATPGGFGFYEWRQHGRVNTIGTYTFRCSHSNPNVAQVPTRDPTYGHRCRALFTARKGFRLLGFDGSGMQLRLMAHHMAEFDEGRYAQVFVRDEDPHEFMRDSIGVDLMGEGKEGRAKGKTIDYALPFGGGELRLGSIVSPHASDAEKKRIGKAVKERLGPTFGEGFDKLKNKIRTYVEEKGYLVGLDGRKAYTNKAHTGLSTLLQMGEAIVMRVALIILDEELQARGYKCGVLSDGSVNPDCDYEFAANVHDEAQMDVREELVDEVTTLALWCVAEAGRRLGLRCPLKSDVKVGNNWQETH